MIAIGLKWPRPDWGPKYDSMIMLHLLLVTSPAGALAKYCDEHVCLCPCLSVSPRRYLRNHMRDLYHFFLHVAYVSGSVLLRHRLSPGRGWRECTARAKCNLRLSCCCCCSLFIVCFHIKQAKLVVWFGQQAYRYSRDFVAELHIFREP